MWDHFFPFFSHRDFKSLKVLDIWLQELRAKSQKVGRLFIVQQFGWVGCNLYSLGGSLFLYSWVAGFLCTVLVAGCLLYSLRGQPVFCTVWVAGWFLYSLGGSMFFCTVWVAGWFCTVWVGRLFIVQLGWAACFLYSLGSSLFLYSLSGRIFLYSFCGSLFIVQFGWGTFTKPPLFRRNRLNGSGNPTFESWLEGKGL